jgi:uncharacterized membrane protein (UPF0127 family)
LCAALVVAVAVSACASGNDSDDTSTASTASTAAPRTSSVVVVPESVVDDTVASNPVVTDAPSVQTKDVRTRADGLTSDGVQPVGFSTITARVTAVDGEVCEVCLWLADDPDERSQGLMGVTDLGEAVGMAFVWDEPVQNRFFMFQTPTPLSIAWFDDLGGYISDVDMAPCLGAVSSVCDRYQAGAPYVTAVEMIQGELDVIGIGPGATVELLAGTESPGCVHAG